MKIKSDRMVFWNHLVYREWRCLGAHSRENMGLRVRSILLRNRLNAHYPVVSDCETKKGKV